MGYSTDFKGSLKFNEELTGSQLAAVSSFFDEDCREHPDWIDAVGLTYVDLQLLSDFSGVEWSGAEKTYGMVDMVNMITVNMRQTWPDFKFTGKLLAQGEEIDDRWELVISEDGTAAKKDLSMIGVRINCPNCNCDFIHEDQP